MIDKKHFSTKSLVGSVTAINVLGNLLGVGLTFIYFGVLMPRLLHGSPIGPLGSTVGFFVAVVAFVMAFNTRTVWPLVSEMKQRLSKDQQDTFEPEEVEGLRQLVGKLVKLPVKLAGTTLAAWVLAALAWLGWAQMAPDLYPWSPETSYRCSAWMILVAAPITMLWVYFAQERSLRLKIPELFPAEALESVSPTFKINV